MTSMQNIFKINTDHNLECKYLGLGLAIITVVYNNNIQYYNTIYYENFP